MPLLVIVYEAPLGAAKVFTLFVCYTRVPSQSVGLIVAYPFDQEEISCQKFPISKCLKQAMNTLSVKMVISFLYFLLLIGLYFKQWHVILFPFREMF